MDLLQKQLGAPKLGLEQQAQLVKQPASSTSRNIGQHCSAIFQCAAMQTVTFMPQLTLPHCA